MGRDFDDRDRPDSPPVAVVNQAFATRHFGDANPIGRTIITGGETLAIVGLAADAKVMSLKDERPIAMAFGAFTQLKATAPISRLRFAVRADEPENLRTGIANVIRGVDPRLAVEFRTMRDEADATVNRERLMAWMAGIFAALGLVMAVIGLYGTFTYVVARRRSEIGVRMADRRRSRRHPAADHARSRHRPGGGHDRGPGRRARDRTDPSEPALRRQRARSMDAHAGRGRRRRRCRNREPDPGAQGFADRSDGGAARRMQVQEREVRTTRSPTSYFSLPTSHFPKAAAAVRSTRRASTGPPACRSAASRACR